MAVIPRQHDTIRRLLLLCVISVSRNGELTLYHQGIDTHDTLSIYCQVRVSALTVQRELEEFVGHADQNGIAARLLRQLLVKILQSGQGEEG